MFVNCKYLPEYLRTTCQ